MSINIAIVRSARDFDGVIEIGFSSVIGFNNSKDKVVGWIIEGSNKRDIYSNRSSRISIVFL